MLKRTACFTGHRFLSREKIPIITRQLENVIDDLVSQGVIFYGSGGAIGFDLLSGFIVLEMKKKHPQIKLIMVLPCKDQDSKWHQHDKVRYRELLARAGKTVFLQERYDGECMLRRNRHLVDNSSVCIAYLKQKKGGTLYTVNYAKKMGRRIINIAEEM